MLTDSYEGHPRHPWFHFFSRRDNVAGGLGVASPAGKERQRVSESRRTIRFICSNCISPVEARRRQAGAKIRCPWCQTILTVPQESRAEPQLETYAVSDGSAEAAAPPAEPEVRFKCSVCRTVMSAAPNQVGQKVVCPDCGTPAVVPAPSQQETVSRSPAAPSEPADIYNVLEGRDQPPPTAKEVYQRYVPVVCSLCHTRMLATKEQVGQVMVCPDCGTENTVPPPAADSQASGPEAMEGYDLAATPGTPTAAPGGPAAFTFTCPLCHTRLEATRDQAGQPITCPDCGTPFRIPPPPDEQPHWDPFQEAVGVYDLAAPPGASPGAAVRPVPAEQPAPVERASAPAAPAEQPAAPGRPAAGPEPASPKPLSEPRRVREEKEEFPAPRRPRPKLPPWPLVNGVFVFPFYRESWLASVKFTLGTLLAWGLAALALPVLAAVAASSFVFGLMYFVWASKWCLTILTQTANGVDRIEDWSTEDFVERAFASLYLINSLIASMLIGWGIESLAPTLPPGAGTGGAVFLLFPVVLLSMLETGSVLNPISRAVSGSLLTRWWAWCGFYLLAGLLVAAVVGVEQGLRTLGGPWAALPAAIFTATAMLVYFRLLGRLGWCITERSRRRAKQSEK